MKTPIAGLLLALAATTAVASEGDRQLLGDHLTLPEQVTRSSELPQRGTTMDRVRAHWGAPQQALPAVGDPPISRWIYDDFTVYFEYRQVIHSVPTDGDG